MTETQIILLLITVLTTLREGFQQRDRVEPSGSVRFVWHMYGWLIRFLVFALLYLAGSGWIILSASVFVMWPIYNVACNIGMKKKWYYLSDKGIDKYIKRFLKL